mmetsp:Transcript_15637/g.49449  ORF Transcript_15637/g.49449 Transcript_15637/m.49449 type:complete len:296 (-) Transcript_15637:249-1136(-)
MRVELLEELGQEGENAILPLVLQVVQLANELLDVGCLETHIIPLLGGDVHGLHEGLRERLLVALDLVAEARLPVHVGHGHLGEARPEALELLLQLRLDGLDLPADGVVLRVRAVRGAELRLAVLGVGHGDDAAAEPRDHRLELGEAAAAAAGPGDAHQPPREGLGQGQGRGEELEALLVGPQQLVEVAQALGRDVLVHHGVALGLQRVAPDPRGRALQVHRHLFEAVLELLRHLRPSEQEFHGLLPRADLGRLAQGRAEPLAQEPEAAGHARVVHELQQGALVGALKRLQHLQGC